MRFALFCHSLYSDWNHGNAHFLRGVVSELLRRGHEVGVYEPRDAWSVSNMLKDGGRATVRALRGTYPGLRPRRYDGQRFDVAAAVQDADVVLVHEWNAPELVRRLGRARRNGGRFLLLFHDTHHRMVSAPEQMAGYELAGYDAVMAFGQVIRDLYLERGLARRAYTWHEAADTHAFRKLPAEQMAGDLVWIGNWGDDERAAELREFLIEPVRRLGLKARLHGVRYPEPVLQELGEAGIEYGGWLPNFLAPQVYSRFRVTLHIPRGPYTQKLPGIPTIRVFEALSCGIPLVCSPWRDTERLFTPGKDYLVAQNGAEMTQHLRQVLADPQHAADLAGHGLATISQRHTCSHRVDQLLEICTALRPLPRPAAKVASMTTPMTGSNGNGNGTATGRRGLKIAFFGSSLVSAYWNGAATYYRGIARCLFDRGHHITFYEPDAFERQQHRDIPDPLYARSVVYSADGESGVRAALREARAADVVVKASGVGVFDALLEAAVLELKRRA